MKRIYLIDCPGIVPISAKDSETDTVLKGVVRVENLQTPAEHIPGLLERVRPAYIERTYGLEPREGGWVGEEGASVLLSTIAKRMGKLLKGGEPDQESIAKIMLNDWIRGKIPYFAMPPDKTAEPEVVKEGEVEESLEDKAVQEELAAREAELSKVLGERKVKGVEQPLRNIITMSKFIGDDNRKFTDDQSDEEMVTAEGYDKSDDEDEADAAEGEDEMVWDDLFPKAGSSKQAAPTKGDDSDDGGLDADLGSDEELDSEGDEDLDEDEEEEEDEDEDEDEVAEPVVSAKQKGKRGKPQIRNRLVSLKLTFNLRLQPLSPSWTTTRANDQLRPLE
jgi:nuclear GTP-binding protein